MKLSAYSAAQMIDISAVQAQHGKTEIDELLGIARKYQFIAVHVLPGWVSYLKNEMKENEKILIGAPVGFPSGGNKTEVKVLEAQHLVQDGVDEMDMMLNVGKLRSGDFDYVRKDIQSVIEKVHPVPVKVILEVHYLNTDQIKRACEICIGCGADFIKTATGWAQTGATVEIIELITSFVGDAVKVKAAGGVRGLDMFIQMYKMGVQRFGINTRASMALIDEIRKMPGGEIEIE